MLLSQSIKLYGCFVGLNKWLLYYFILLVFYVSINHEEGRLCVWANSYRRRHVLVYDKKIIALNSPKQSFKIEHCFSLETSFSR